MVSGKKIVSQKSGKCAAELFEEGIGLTYDDITILDTFFTSGKKEADLSVNLGKGVKLNLPIIASPMDTVTNAQVCISLALHGGIGVLHYNHKDQDNNKDINAQVDEIKKVKRFQNGFIEKPVTVSPEHTINQVIEIGVKYSAGIQPIKAFPVTENGKPDGKLVGMLGKNDYSRNKNTGFKVKDRMIPLNKISYGKLPITEDEAFELLWKKRVSHLPIVDDNMKLRYLVTRTDIEKKDQFPFATKDSKNRLSVLFAVETWQEIGYERLKKCFDAGADGCVIDTSQGFTVYEQEMIKYIKKIYPDKLLIGGNIATTEAAEFLKKEGVDAFRCGQGSGSICTTAGTIGISRAGATAVYHSKNTIKNSDIKLIADGGLRQVGDIIKALALGADCVMLGNMLAGTAEGPGETITDRETGQPVKVYRGMGSKEANVNGIRGYSILPQGISGTVSYKGSLNEWLPLIVDGMKSGFKVLNCSSIKELHEKLMKGDLRFERRTAGSMKESKPHNVK